MNIEIDREKLLLLKEANYEAYQVIISCSSGEDDYCKTLDMEKLKRECELGYFDIEDLFTKEQVSKHINESLNRDGIHISSEGSEDIYNGHDMYDPSKPILPSVGDKYTLDPETNKNDWGKLEVSKERLEELGVKSNAASSGKFWFGRQQGGKSFTREMLESIEEETEKLKECDINQLLNREPDHSDTAYFECTDDCKYPGLRKAIEDKVDLVINVTNQQFDELLDIDKDLSILSETMLGAMRDINRVYYRYSAEHDKYMKFVGALDYDTCYDEFYLETDSFEEPKEEEQAQRYWYFDVDTGYFIESRKGLMVNNNTVKPYIVSRSYAYFYKASHTLTMNEEIRIDMHAEANR